jgi:hypothetical protein
MNSMKLCKTTIYAFHEVIDVYTTRSIFNTRFSVPWLRRPACDSQWHHPGGAKKALRGNMKRYFRTNPHWLRGDEP